MPSGTVTFLFTDIEESTRIWNEQGTSMPTALARHDEIVPAAFQAHGGYVFASGGDGFAIAFHRAADALAAAVEAQRQLVAESWPADAELHVRMGLHTGEAVERDGNYYGPPVNLAARLMAAGHGGLIVLSATTAEVIGRGSGVELVDLGLHRLRGMTDVVHAFGVRADGLPWRDRPLATVRETIENLPHTANEFVGRSAEVGHLVAELAVRRLITLTGPGGVGKTRLSVEVGWAALDAYPDGVWLVELAAVTDPDAVVHLLALNLSIRRQEAMSMVEAVVDWMPRAGCC